jgi:hypothetical protein
MEAPQTKQLPTLTVPQLLAFAAFLIVLGLALFGEGIVKSNELSEVRVLAAFLIGALLPSDALIRYGRTLWAKSASAEAAKEKETPVTLADAPRATLPQVLAFLAFAFTAILVLVNNDLVSEADFDQVEDLLRVLIVALLPSEAAIRFARARYLRDVEDVTAQHVKRI